MNAHIVHTKHLTSSFKSSAYIKSDPSRPLSYDLSYLFYHIYYQSYLAFVFISFKLAIPTIIGRKTIVKLDKYPAPIAK